MEPLVLRCRILAPYVPLRATSSKSVPSVDIVYIVRRSVTKTEFRNCLYGYLYDCHFEYDYNRFIAALLDKIKNFPGKQNSVEVLRAVCYI